MSERKVCLCVIFNHPFVQNIPLLREIYAGRFEHVRFIVPLQYSSDDDVITVYRGSFAHNAYLVDARTELGKIDCSHYLCVHDDILLAPHLNQYNILDALDVTGDAEAFMPAIYPSPRDIGDWGLWASGLWHLLHPRNVLSGTGVDNFETVKRELPPISVAAEKLGRFGATATTRIALTSRSLGAEADLHHFPYFSDRRTPEQNARFLRVFAELLFDTTVEDAELEVEYPFVISGPTADFSLLPKSTFDTFCHYSGVLAAAGLWVEIAYPTALVLANERVKTAQQSGVGFIWSGPVIDPDETLDQMERDRTLIAGHPIKLSMVGDKDAYLRRIHGMSTVASPASTPPGTRAPRPADADLRAAVLDDVLGAVLASIKPRALDRKRFQEAIRRSAATPREGPEDARHAMLLAQAQRVLGIDSHDP